MKSIYYSSSITRKDAKRDKEEAVQKRRNLAKETDSNGKRLKTEKEVTMLNNVENRNGDNHHSQHSSLHHLNSFKVEESNGNFVVKLKGDSTQQESSLVIKYPTLPSQSNGTQSKTNQVIQSQNPEQYNSKFKGKAPPIPVVGDPVLASPRFSNRAFVHPTPNVANSQTVHPINTVNSSSFFNTSNPPSLPQNNSFFDTAPIHSTSAASSFPLYSSRSQEAQQILKQWLKDHVNHPFPNDEELLGLSRSTGLSAQHIDQWFITMRSLISRQNAHSVNICEITQR
eukprot:TRINITY_DN611_c0_g3_i3.p1 TRINITY_DN611_c0_g3~~TRINITY_DN611_c0_g3_i3.p1  ORF type:complete len:284 (+),score=65.68 TRINITY_DN611_c0_g3_i3:178-1029(+)